MTEETIVTKDCNGNILNDGDSVQLNKDLKLKGSSTTYKIGTVFKNIRTISDPEAIECRDGKTTIVLKTMFIKKRN
jgi:protein PhnA